MLRERPEKDSTKMGGGFWRSESKWSWDYIPTPDEAVQQSEVHLWALRWQVNELRRGVAWMRVVVPAGFLLIAILLWQLNIQARRMADAPAPGALEAAQHGLAHGQVAVGAVGISGSIPQDAALGAEAPLPATVAGIVDESTNEREAETNSLEPAHVLNPAGEAR